MGQPFANNPQAAWQRNLVEHIVSPLSVISVKEKAAAGAVLRLRQPFALP